MLILLVFLYLFQAERLSSLSGASLAAEVRANPDNAVLVGKCVIAARTGQQREQFLKAVTIPFFPCSYFLSNLKKSLVLFQRETLVSKFDGSYICLKKIIMPGIKNCQKFYNINILN